MTLLNLLDQFTSRNIKECPGIIRVSLVIVEEGRISVSSTQRRDQLRDTSSSPISNDDPKRPMRDAGISHLVTKQKPRIYSSTPRLHLHDLTLTDRGNFTLLQRQRMLQKRLIACQCNNNVY